MICDKIGFETYKIAMVSASRQKKKSRHKYQAYKCFDCGKFHLTTITKTLKPHREDKLRSKYPNKFDHYYNARKKRKK